MSHKGSYVCNGSDFSILLQPGHLTLRPRLWGKSSERRLPLRDVRTVIVERKSIMPFATLTVLSMILAVTIRYNAFWFLMDLSHTVASDLAAISIFFFAIPTMSRVLFVNVLISSVANDLWRIRFVPTRSGKHLVTAFHELTGSTT